uniref:AlNc14C263G9837 protein n=1 Tax=Albugo laibachii Nc14 TaxID=890382 RepID=F0WU13_9STRA|nr:AlNc14C263G9837 [Albugo laibachii Nc14]|eukprot:CCA24858.1 AlNc14C263G9837 [Albugo laibachii Nc14]
MHVAGMNVEQQETELFSAGTSTERDLNCEVSQKGYAIVTTRTSCEMDDKLLTTHVIVEASIETTTEFQKKQEFVRVKSAFSLIFLLKGSNHKEKDSTWSFTETCNKHNHEPFTSKNAHPIHMRMSGSH